VAIDRSGEQKAMAARLAELLPRLNERDRRLALGAEARAWGRGGIEEVHRATGMARSTISRGKRELETGDTGPTGRIRAEGGGRKNAEATDPGLIGQLDRLIEPESRGDPESPLRWTTKSTRNLANELTELGHKISHSVVGKLLRARGYSLQGTRKMLEGAQHPDRDAQFRYINTLAAEFLAAGDPVISVDTLCERSHKASYADLRIMPTSAEKPLVGGLSSPGMLA
jgi:transposase